MGTTSLLSIQEYLGYTPRPDCEYLDGTLLERNVGTNDHANLQGLIYAYFLTRQVKWGITAFVEQRVQVSATRFRVPDVVVLLGAPKGQILQEPPFLCIEILSPDDRMAEMRERIQDYLNFGVKWVWAIDPATRFAMIYDTSTGVEVKNGKLYTCDPQFQLSLFDLTAASFFDRNG